MEEEKMTIKTKKLVGDLGIYGMLYGIVFFVVSVLTPVFSIVTPAFAQSDYPSRPIQVVVPFPGGGSSGLVATIVSEKMSEVLGKPVVVVNKPGGATSVGTVFAANSKPDGYTILLGAGATITLTLTMDDPPYKVSDITPVGRMTSNDFILAVHKSVPANNLKEFIAFARANPGKLSFVAGSSGSLPRLGGELLKDKAKFDAQYIPYANPTQSMPALLGGHVQYGVVEAPASIPHIKSKDLKPLAIFSTKRHPDLPDVPTFVEQGYPDVVTYTYFILYVPVKTPAPIIAKLENALRLTMQDKEVQQKIAKGDNRADFLGTKETQVFVANEEKKWSDIIKRSKLDFKQ
jgi:tripartite-type tricarboxylate transporter receptor subunit TctC